MKPSIRWLYYILFFLTPLLMNPQTSEIFEFNKIIFIYAMTTIIAATWLIQQVIYKKSFRLPWLFIAAAIFFLSQLVSTVYSIDVHTSIFGYYGRFNGGLLSIIAYVVLFYIFFDVFTYRDILTLLKVSLVSSLIVILWAIPGKLGADLNCLLFTGEFSNNCWTEQFRPSERIFSTIGQPNWLGAFLAVHFFIGLYFYLRSAEGKSKNFSQYLYVGYIALNFISILFTRSRSSIGAVGISLMIFCFIVISNSKNDIKMLLKKIGIIFAILVIAAVIFKTGITKVDQFLVVRSTPVQEKSVLPEKRVAKLDILVTDSLDIRKIVWDGAIKLGLQYPLFGTGVETFAYSYYFVRPTEHNLTSEWDFIYNKAHNEFLNYFATTGFFGLISYLVFIISVLCLYGRLIWQGTGEEKLFYAALVSAYITIIITNFFGFSTTTINLCFYILSAVPLVPQHAMKDEKRPKNWFIEFFSIGLGMFGIGVLWLILQYYQADLTYTKANEYFNQDEYQQAMNYYSDALDIKYEHIYEDRLSNSLANLAIVAYLQEETELAQKLIDLSDGYNKKTLRVAAKNVLYWKTKAKNEYLFHQIDKKPNYLSSAIKALETAEQISPTDPKIPYTIALFYQNLYEDEQSDSKKIIYLQTARSYIDKSLKLKPNYVESLELKKQIEINE